MFKLTCYSAGVHALIFLLIAAVSQIQSSPAKLQKPTTTVKVGIIGAPVGGSLGTGGGGGSKTPAPGTPKPAPTRAVITPATAKPTIVAPQPTKEPVKTATPKTKDPTPQPVKEVKKTATPAVTATPAQPSKVIAKNTPDPKKPTPTPVATPWAPPVSANERNVKEVAQLPARPDNNTTANRATPAAGAAKPGAGLASPIAFGSGQPGALGSGTPGAIGGGSNDPDALLLDGWWVQNSLGKIIGNFKLPKSMAKPGVTCEILFTINRAGIISEVEVLRSSGDATLNDYAVKALKDTENLPPLPETVKKNILRLSVTFDFSGQQ